jgi:hypothetical protein
VPAGAGLEKMLVEKKDRRNQHIGSNSDLAEASPNADQGRNQAKTLEDWGKAFGNWFEGSKILTAGW